MTKLEETKKILGCRKDGPRCGNCKYYTSDIQKHASWDGTVEYPAEKNTRCSLGKFAVKKTAWCNKHEWRKV